MSDLTRQCPVTRNGYPCSRPEHGDEIHDFPRAAYFGTSLVPDAWITAMANPPERDPNNQTSHWRSLYTWLGEQARSGYREARDNELAANLDASVGPRYMADACREVRRRMRQLDPSLRKEHPDQY